MRLALVLGGLLVAGRSQPASPPPTVSIVNPRPGTPTAPAAVSPAELTLAFKVQVQAWNDVADLASVEVDWCPVSADPELPSSWGGPAIATLNAAYSCGLGCGVYDVVLTTLAPGDYRLVARASSVLDGIGRSSDGRQGDARWVHVRVLAAGTGTGMILVRDSSSQLCMDCHAHESHSSKGSDGRYGNWQTVCLDCHTPHSTRNRSLVKDAIQTPGGALREVKLYTARGDGSGGPVNSSAGAATAGVCQVCHTRTQGRAGEPRWRSTGNADATHYQAGGPNGARPCASCHFHAEGFSHGKSGVGCEKCHGHDARWGGSTTQGVATFGSHSTHTEGDADDLRGPNIGCEGCHDLTRFPFFATGTDADGDGRITLAETNVCDGCHSPGGAVNGVDDPAVGARPNWRSGVYAGAKLAPGKERWCAGCHDSGTSVIPAVGGRQAPDVAGDDATHGYYVNGHGRMGTECAACHDEASSHNLDGRRTYAGALDNYGQGFRLSAVDVGAPLGPVPALNVPREADGCTTFLPQDFALCFKCHDAKALLSDVRSQGWADCTSNPYRSAASLTTELRNVSVKDPYYTGDPKDLPSNIHADHLLDGSRIAGHWTSDGPGTPSGNSVSSCPTCHDPHGGKRDDGTATVAMTHGVLAVSHGQDATGTFGMLGSRAWQTDPQRKLCGAACHYYGGERWYQTVAPAIVAFGAADADPGNPAAAEAGFTNGATVTITLAASGYPSELNLAQDAAFLQNPTGWRPFSPASTFTLTPGDGPRTIFAQVRNLAGTSAAASASIVLDTVPPTFGGGGVTSPNGGEIWDQGTTHAVTWTSASETNPRPGPISLALSLDAGATFPYAIASSEPDDGQYAWSLPAVAGTAARVRITATDRAGNQASDASGSSFTIRVATPVVESFTVADADPSDPAPAEAGFTNSRPVAVAIAASRVPTLMQLAQDSGFTVNATGWLPFATAAQYQLSVGDGAKAIYVRLRNPTGTSATASASITVDTLPPTIAAGTLTAPNGGERWGRSSAREVTWLASGIADANLPPAPIALHASTDSGGTWPTQLVAGEPNDGSWTWTLPASLSWRARVRLTATDRAGNQSRQGSAADFGVMPPYVVTTTADSGAGSLRQALSNLVAAGGNDSIWFDVPAPSLTGGVAVVNLLSRLAVSAPGIVVDATSQAGLQGETNPRGPEVRLHGWSTTDRINAVAFLVTGATATIRGFQLTGFHHPVHTSADSTTVQGNHFCFRSDAATPYTAAPNALAVVAETSGSVPASRLLFGGSGSADRNHVAGCSSDAYYQASGVRLYGQFHAVLDNLFGLLPGGAPLANGSYAAVHDTGVADSLQRNQVSGSDTGFLMAGTLGRASGNVFGLYFDGTAWNGRTPQQAAIALTGSGQNVVGGSIAATSDADLRDSNVISSTATGTGVSVLADYGGQSVIAGNFIGTNPARTQRFTGGVGVRLAGPLVTTTIVGADLSGAPPNVIANQSDAGVLVGDGASLVSIVGNLFEGNGASAPGSDDAIRLVGSANGGITRPVVAAATSTSVTVTGVGSGDFVEVYRSDYDGTGSEYGEGRARVGGAWATGTSVDVSAAGLLPGQWVTATRSSYVPVENPDPEVEPTWYLNTSAFSANVRVQ